VLDPNLQTPEEELLPEAIAWADMLARIREKHARLSRAAEALRRLEPDRSPALRPRPSLLEEIENERGRIARELHAGVGQPLASIKMNLELLDAWSKTMPEEVRQVLTRLNHLADAALGQVRAVSHRLHPPEWQDLSVNAALRELVNESGVTRKCETVLGLGPLPSEPPHAAKVVLYRCAQECISNVLRHSEATRFSLILTQDHGPIEMTIHDNGQGIPDDALRGGGIGLASIREHAASVDGVVHISSGSEGTTIQISIPLTED
jgi:two-component system, NarL family, sensor kinase